MLANLQGVESDVPCYYIDLLVAGPVYLPEEASLLCLPQQTTQDGLAEHWGGWLVGCGSCNLCWLFHEFHETCHSVTFIVVVNSGVTRL